MNPKIGTREGLILLTVWTVGLFGYLAYGLVAVGYVLQVFLVLVAGWGSWHLGKEYLPRAIKQLQKDQAFDEWKRNQQRRDW